MKTVADLTDDQVKQIMVDPELWPLVVEGALSGEPGSDDVHDLMVRARRLYNAGAPCLNVQTGEIE